MTVADPFQQNTPPPSSSAAALFAMTQLVIVAEPPPIPNPPLYFRVALPTIAQRVIVMYASNIVEMASVDDLYENPQHPYTLGLLGAVPRLDTAGKKRLMPIPGRPPDLSNPPAGCAFAPRCPYRVEKCLTDRPELTRVKPDHYSACWVEIQNHATAKQEA